LPIYPYISETINQSGHLPPKKHAGRQWCCAASPCCVAVSREWAGPPDPAPGLLSLPEGVGFTPGHVRAGPCMPIAARAAPSAGAATATGEEFQQPAALRAASTARVLVRHSTRPGTFLRPAICGPPAELSHRGAILAPGGQHLGVTQLMQ